MSKTLASRLALFGTAYPQSVRPHNGTERSLKAPISVLSLATITVAAILFTIFVITNGHAEAEQVLLVFALILFGPVSLLYLVLNDPWLITVEAIVLLTATPGLLLAATFWRSSYSVILKRLGWFLWVVCSLMVAGIFI
jgi:hypothetical protein